MRLLKCQFRALNSHEILPISRWKILRSKRIGSSIIIDAIGSTKNGLSTQKAHLDLLSFYFSNNILFIIYPNFVTERPLFKYHQIENNKSHTGERPIRSASDLEPPTPSTEGLRALVRDCESDWLNQETIDPNFFTAHAVSFFKMAEREERVSKRSKIFLIYFKKLLICF